MSKSEEVDRIKDILKDMGRGPIHSFGQNFLVNREIAAKIASAVPEENIDHIVEIGPGMGILTDELLKRGASLTSIEKDSILAEELIRITHREYSTNLKVIKGDAAYIIPQMLRNNNQEIFIVSNLPFNISSTIMGGILDNTPFVEQDRICFKGGVIMFQYEFARRLISQHGSKEYGRLSVMFQSKMQAFSLMKVSRSMFYPVPKVDAAVIKFHPKKNNPAIPRNPDIFNKLVHVVFLNRRKKLKNTVHPPSMGIDLEKEDIVWILDDMEIADLRPEDIPPEVFVEISDRISELK